MPWKEATTMSLRLEFVEEAGWEGANMADLCRSFGISRKTGYKWLKRYEQEGEAGLVDRCRRPDHSPLSTAPAMVEAVLSVREAHPTWGGRKIRAYLLARQVAGVPAASTVTEILRRQGRIDPEEAAKHRPWQRFQMAQPNDLWQMDFKDYLELSDGRCHPLTVLDDHSRYLLGLYACPNQTGRTVQACLTDIFRHSGLPEAILTDNGPPWGSASEVRYTRLSVWLLRLGVLVTNSHPYHPQTLGKDERFHRTLGEDLLACQPLVDRGQAQEHFDRFRHHYNHERPHQALGLTVPAAHYRASQRTFPEYLPPITYPPGTIVRRVDNNGKLTYTNRVFRVPKAFCGYPVALYPTTDDGILDVYFCHFPVAQIDLHPSCPDAAGVTHVSEHL